MNRRCPEAAEVSVLLIDERGTLAANRALADPRSSEALPQTDKM